MSIIKVLTMYTFILCNGCNKSESQSGLTWYKASVNSLYNYDNGNYVVGLGISARAFYLNKNDKNYKKILKSLKDSYKTKKVIEVAYTSADDSRSKIVQIKI